MAGRVVYLSDYRSQRESKHLSNPDLRYALEKFIWGASLDILKRPPTTTEVQDWVNQMFAGASRTTVALCLLNSAERRQSLLRTYYEIFLGRTPTAEGLSFWMELLSSGKKHEDVIAAMLSSHEYLEKNGLTHEAYIRALYRDVYGRKPTDTETNSWVGLLNSHSATKLCVAYNFVVSEEFQKHMVRRWYLEFMCREPDIDGLRYCLGKLREGEPHENIIASLLASSEYFTRTQVRQLPYPPAP